MRGDDEKEAAESEDAIEMEGGSVEVKDGDNSATVRAKKDDDDDDYFANIESKYIIKDEEVKRGKKLGEGAFGVVVRGKYHNSTVAVKVSVFVYDCFLREKVVEEEEN